MTAHSGIQHNIRLSLDSSEALAALMKRTGLNRNQAINFSILNTAQGHDGYYAQMSAYQSAIAAAAAIRIGQMMQRTPEDLRAFSDFVLFLAEEIHGPMPEAPVYRKRTAAHEPIAKAFFDALEAHYAVKR